jgi:hypothetical protein
MVGNLKVLARLFGLPYVPITPLWPLAGLAGLIPLPSKWRIEFGSPIQTAHYDDGELDDPMLMTELSEQVRETIQLTLCRLLINRRYPFLG